MVKVYSEKSKRMMDPINLTMRPASCCVTMRPDVYPNTTVTLCNYAPRFLLCNYAPGCVPKHSIV